MSPRLPRELEWVIFWVCDGVDFQFPTLCFFVLFHLSLVLSTMKVTSLNTRWVWPDSVQFNICPCLSPSWCVTFIARDSNVFCLNFWLLITDNQSFPFKVKHLSESRPGFVTLLSVTSRSIHSSKLVRPGPGPRSLLPDGGDKNFWLSERRDS